jgi:hypothetical protein
MVALELSDFTTEKQVLISIINSKRASGLLIPDLNHHFNDKAKYSFDEIEKIIDAIGTKLRKCEMIYHTYFDSTFDRMSLVNSSLIGKKIIEVEFFFDTKITRNRIEIEDVKMYFEHISNAFQDFILLIASLLENFVRLIEILVRKIIVHGEKSPHVSTPFLVLLEYWDNLVKLQYRKRSDPLYKLLLFNKPFFERYLLQINSLRNRFIHGYGTNLEVDFNNLNVTNLNTTVFRIANPPVLIPSLTVESFTKDILINIQSSLKTFLTLAINQANGVKQKLPM